MAGHAVSDADQTRATVLHSLAEFDTLLAVGATLFRVPALLRQALTAALASFDLA